jgi:tetratricopeptide (TPR) repeat protein
MRSEGAAQATDAPAAVPESGSLETQPLPELLLGLYRRRAGGRLDLSREGVRKRVWLRSGVPVLAESNLPSESLGIQLLDGGRITRDDYARVVEAVRERGCREGAALLSLQLVGPKELFDALKEQVRRRLLDCFGWPRGEYSFDPDDVPAADATAFRCDPVALAHEGVAIHWPPSRLRTILSPRFDRYAVPTSRLPALAERLPRDSDVEALLGELDGSRRLGDVLTRAPGPTALAAAWVLDRLGAFAWSDTPRAGEAAEEVVEPEIEVVVGSRGSEAPRRPAAEKAERAAAAPRPGAALSGASALRKQIVDLHGSLGSRNHYELLGVATDADTEQIKRSYFSAAKRFHPDALGRLGLAELRAEAEAVFARISQAYEVLRDPAARRDYDRALAGEAQESDAGRLVQAEALYRKGEIMLRAGNFQGALEFLQGAVQLWPEESAYQSALGWALYKKRPSDPQTARPHLERAIAIDGNDAVAHFRLGLVLRSLGDTKAADRELDLAKRLDPKVR